MGSSAEPTLQKKEPKEGGRGVRPLSSKDPRIAPLSYDEQLHLFGAQRNRDADVCSRVSYASGFRMRRLGELHGGDKRKGNTNQEKKRNETRMKK